VSILREGGEMILISKKERLAFENGIIEGWRHIKAICNSCIKAHREEKKRLNLANKIREGKDE